MIVPPADAPLELPVPLELLAPPELLAPLELVLPLWVEPPPPPLPVPPPSVPAHAATVRSEAPAAAQRERRIAGEIWVRPFDMRGSPGSWVAGESSAGG